MRLASSEGVLVYAVRMCVCDDKLKVCEHDILYKPLVGISPHLQGGPKTDHF